MMWLPVIAILIFLYYNSNNSKSGGFKLVLKNSDELLKERFAKGEIDETTYLQMKETLKK